MPYTSRDSLPPNVRLPLSAVPHAQDIYVEAFNNAWQEYKSAAARRGHEERETVSHRVAWSAVKKKYIKGSDRKWHPKGE